MATTNDQPGGQRVAVARTLVLGLRAEAAREAVVLFATNDLEAADECDAHSALDEGRLSWVRAPQGHRGS